MALYKWERSSILYKETYTEKHYGMNTIALTSNNGDTFVYTNYDNKPELDAETGLYTIEEADFNVGIFGLSRVTNSILVFGGPVQFSIEPGSGNTYYLRTKIGEGRTTGRTYSATPAKGVFVDYVYSADPDTYPNGGTSENYWYSGRTELSPPVLSVPQIAMQGNQITVSWSAVDGADGYILERKANTDSDWTQVYSGANLTFSETVGTWTSVQYRVKAGVSGTYGDYTTSASVPVVSASALVISGSDGNLGTLVNDVSYTVSSDGTTALMVIENINGVTTKYYTAINGATNTIPVMDIPTGSGTIKIIAYAVLDSGVVTVTRSWTYSKTAPTFANAGSTAQLQQNGKNVFPLTLLECVRGIENLAPGGYGPGQYQPSLAENIDTLDRTGLYLVLPTITEGTLPPSVLGNSMLLHLSYDNTPSSYQYYYPLGITSGDHFKGCVLMRTIENGSIGPWEWINSPMQLGIEYQTIERYNGNPVYTKAVSLGTVSGGGTKSVEHGVTDLEACIECNGFAGHQNLVGNKYVNSITVGASVIELVTDSNFPSQAVVAIMKYTKTTD